MTRLAKRHEIVGIPEEIFVSFMRSAVVANRGRLHVANLKAINTQRRLHKVTLAHLKPT